MKKEFDSEKLIPLIKEAVLSGKEVKFTVKGNSMYPLLLTGRDSVIVAKADNVKVADVVFYQRETGKYVLHRIIGIDKSTRTYTMCGDNETETEPNIPFDSVFAKAISFERKNNCFSKNNVFYKVYTFLWMKLLKKRQKILRLLIKIKKIYFF